MLHPDVEFKRLLVRYKDWKKQFRDRLGATQKVGGAWGGRGAPQEQRCGQLRGRHPQTAVSLYSLQLLHTPDAVPLRAARRC